MSDTPHRSTDRLLHLLKAGGPQTAAALAAALGVTAVAVRQMLDRLAADGLVRHEDRRESVGRPKRYWQLAARGDGRFPDAHAALTLDVLDGVVALFGEDGLDRLLARREAGALASYRQALDAVPPSRRLRALADLRTREGYMADILPDEGGPDGEAGVLLVENHCPIRGAATACPGLCRSELALLRALLGPGVTVTRTEHIIADSRRCAYRITGMPTD